MSGRGGVPDRRAPDALVVGGGVIGLATAVALRRAGGGVRLLERGQAGGGATGAAGGMLSPLAEARRTGPFLDMARASLRQFPAFLDEIAALSELAPEFHADGKLLLACDDADARALAERHAWLREAGLEGRLLSGDEARHLEPGVAPDVTAALALDEDAQVDPRALVRALAEAARNTGVEVASHTEAVALIVEDGRAVGVATADGGSFRAGTVVLAAGVWANRIAGLPRRLPIEPVHGELFELQAEAAPTRRVVEATGCYVIPRAGGRVLVGATERRQGFRRRVTAGAAADLLGAAIRLVPALADAELVGGRAGLRPATPDGLPLIGPDADLPGLFHASGHYRNGVLLAPTTADLVADLVQGRPPAFDPAPFRIDRFREPQA